MSRVNFTITLSLLANLGLASVWWWVATSASPVGSVPPPAAVPAVAGPERVVPPAVSPSPVAAPAVASRLEPGMWARLFNAADLRGSILRLRAAGCPEQTLRDLALAHFKRQRSHDPWREMMEKDYWKNPDWDSPEHRKNERELAARTRADGELSKELFGVDLLAEEAREVGYWEDRDFNGNYLPAEKREALRRFLEDFEEKEHELAMRHRGLWDAQRQAETKQLRAEKEKAIAALLSPAEFRLWELRESPTAEELQRTTMCMKLSPAEYEALFDRRKQLASALELGEVQSRSRAETDRVLAAQNELNAHTKQLLGEARATEFARSQGYDYQQLFRASLEDGLPETTAATVFDLRDAALAKANEVANSDKLPEAQRAAIAAALRTETEKALQQALGETLLKKYRDQLNLDWLDALSRIHAVGIDFSCGLAAESGLVFYCIAVG